MNPGGIHFFQNVGVNLEIGRGCPRRYELELLTPKASAAAERLHGLPCIVDEFGFQEWAPRRKGTSFAIFVN